MIQWTVMLIIFFITISSAIGGVKKKNKYEKSKIRFYLKDIIFSIAVILLAYFLVPILFYKIDFQKLGKGFIISQDILSGIYSALSVPFLLSLFMKSNLYPDNIQTAKEIFGFPVQLLPDSILEYFIFSLYIISGVVFEELLCRQFAFWAFNETLHLKGDILLLVTSALFAIGHVYQGWKGLLSSFVMGLLFGKIFQMTGNIFFPIVLHLLLNMTLLSLCYRRIKDLKKIKDISLQSKEDSDNTFTLNKNH